MDVTEYLPLFVAEAREHVQALTLAVVRVEETPDDGEIVDEIFRNAHSLKSMSATMGFDSMAALTHEMEEVFERVRQRRGGLDHQAVDVLLACLDAIGTSLDAVERDCGEDLDPTVLVERLAGLVRAGETGQATEATAIAGPQAAPDAARLARRAGATVRIDADRLDRLVHHMDELVEHRARVESLASHAHVPGLGEALHDLARSAQALQAVVVQIGMVPVESAFQHVPRLVRDLSAQLGKQVELVLSGEETELDRAAVETLGPTLVHLVRNSLDHGLEPSEERIAAGKPPAGVLEISARRAGGDVLVSVRDDGRGIDLAQVAAKAVDRGLMAPGAAPTLDAARAVELLFTPGFSTAERVSDISGRGVGMDAVRTAIRALGGEVEMTSEPGAGTAVAIRLPERSPEREAASPDAAAA